MREFIASDLHGSLVHAQRLFEAFERERADRILLLGDPEHGGNEHIPDLPDQSRWSAAAAGSV